MNQTIRLKPGVWPAQALTPEAAQEHVEGGSARADAIERNHRAFRRLAWGTGGLLASIGLIGMGAAAYVLTNAQPVQRQFSLVNQATGEVADTVMASDAPRLFTDGTAKEYLRKFIESCAAYVHVTRTQAYNRCTALMTPTQQAKYRDAFTSSNPASPQNTIGAAAILVPENLRYSLQPGSGKIQSWLVRYNGVVYRNGQKASTVPQAAMIHFEWRPEMMMTDEQRTWNNAGMRVVDYSFGPDVGS